jgi:hypothetical protein
MSIQNLRNLKQKQGVDCAVPKINNNDTNIVLSILHLQKTYNHQLRGSRHDE